MRAREIEYWDAVAGKIAEKGIRDNWIKRQFLAQFLFKCTWTGEKVLEIGVGCGVSAAMLATSCGMNWEYIGTELSPHFAKMAKEHFGLHVVQGDVLSLPEGKFTRIIALDSLEHVRQEEREQGYRNIADRMEPGALLFLNVPFERSLHEDEFDHGFGMIDFVKLCDSGMILKKYENYGIKYGNYARNYAFAVMERR